MVEPASDPSVGFLRYRVDFFRHRNPDAISIFALTKGDEYKAVALAAAKYYSRFPQGGFENVTVTIVEHGLTVDDLRNDDMHDWYEVG